MCGDCAARSGVLPKADGVVCEADVLHCFVVREAGVLHEDGDVVREAGVLHEDGSVGCIVVCGAGIVGSAGAVH